MHLIEANEPTDLDEIEQAQKEFEAVLKKKMARKPVYRIRKFAQAAAVLCLVFIGANITTEAMFDESFLHMVQSWGNMYEVIPGDNEVEGKETEVRVFNDIESFDAVFSDDFLVCSWLPDGYELTEILCENNGDTINYYWTYSHSDNSEISVRIYSIKSNITASLSGTYLGKTKQYILKNGITVNICENNDEYIACFKYQNWWYVVQTTNDEILTSLMEGMIEYEQD